MLHEWQTIIRWTDRSCSANLHYLTVHKFRQVLFTYRHEDIVTTNFLQGVIQDIVFEWKYHVTDAKENMFRVVILLLRPHFLNTCWIDLLYTIVDTCVARNCSQKFLQKLDCNLSRQDTIFGELAVDGMMVLECIL
jgi:hypothetical protein